MNWWRYLLFLCGQIGLMCLPRFFFQSNIEFARQKTGALAPDGTADILFDLAILNGIILAFRILDGLIDPVVGAMSDTWVRRGRERRKILLYALLVPLAGIAMVFFCHAGLAPAVRWPLVTAGIFIFFLGYTVYGIPYWSLVGDYGGEDANARRALSNLLGAGILLATAIVAVAGPQLIEAKGYFAAAMWISVPCTLLMLGPYFAQPPGVKSSASHGKEPTLKEIVVGTIQHRRFLAVLIIFAGSQMSFTVMTASATTLAVEVLHGQPSDATKLLTPFLLTAIPAFVGVPWLSRRFGWEACVVAASLLLGCVYAGTGLLGGSALGLTPVQTAALIFSLGGPMAAVLLGLEGEAVSACAREKGGDATSIYFGSLNLVVKAMNGVAVFITGLLVKQELFRACGPAAGALLALGCVGYFLVRPRGQPPAAPSPSPAT